MSSHWINALAQLDADGVPAVLITLVDENGSTPRNAGAKMVVSEEFQFDTIGGGHLEYKAIKIARQCLKSGQSQPRLERFSLGASLGQCCGGATTLLFEPLGTQTTNIVLFGAGHVGRALAPILASLPCRLRWVDGRENEFPAIIPESVNRVVTEFPVDEVDDMPAGSFFIVMTHNHQLDQELTERILKRGDFKYFGLIGSQTKRKKFEHRLKAKGFSAEQLQRMTCPIGIADVKGKLPAEIAVSVAAQVITRYNASYSTSYDTRGEIQDKADVNGQKAQTSQARLVIGRLAI